MTFSFRWLFILPLLIAAVACDPFLEKKPDIGNPPLASFTVAQDTGINRYILTNTSADAFLYSWDLGNGSMGEGEEVRAFYAKAGTYTVTLTAFGKGGHATTTQDIVVDQDAPVSCTGLLKDLTNCTSKSWVLDPAPGGMVVGPPGGTQVWWQTDATTPPARPCAYNDEFIFSADGTYEYKTNGDKWVDEEGGATWPTDMGLPIGCTPDGTWPAKYADWLSGTFTYNLVEGTDTTLTLVGTGAHLALYKVGNSGTVAQPQGSITYPVVELTSDVLTVQMDFSWGYWRFRFVPK